MTEKNLYTLTLDDRRATRALTGGKGAALAELVRSGLPVPDGFHITTAAYRSFVEENQLSAVIQEALQEVDISRPSTLENASGMIQKAFLERRIPPAIASEIANTYDALAGRDPVVAVRSSATAEDLPEASFAGQQETFLNIEGKDRLMEAVKGCWASLWTARAIGYRARQELASEDLSLAVVVQILVPAESAGIMFTAHPMTGNRGQILINAAWGLGEAVVGGEVSPDSYLVDFRNQKILEREIHRKEIMTVREDGGTRTEPVPKDLQGAPVLNEGDILELSALGEKIHELYSEPRDIEWARADNKFYILQARPITGLPEVYVPPPQEWEPPDPKARYMRASIIDMMPEPLSPLFSTMGVEIYNHSIQDLLVEITGSKKKGLPEEILCTIQNYAYLKVDFSPREWWNMVIRMGPKMPRLIRKGPDHFREEALPIYRQRIQALDEKPLSTMTAQQLWTDARGLTRAAMDHLAVLQVDTLGAAAGSEGLFTALYEKMFQGEDDPPAAAFLMGYDTIPIQSEKSLYDLAKQTENQPALRTYLREVPSQEIAAALEEVHPPDQVAFEIWQNWKGRFQKHQKEFGYILYNLDFAEPLPEENPQPQLETIKMYLRGEGSNPYQRQEKLAEQRKEAVAVLMKCAKGLRGWAIRRAYKWAENVGQVREDSIASIGLAYPRLRRVLMELSRRFQKSGGIPAEEDIFWLMADEIGSRLKMLEESDPLEGLHELIEERKNIHQAESRYQPPSQIPHSDKYMGISVDAFIPGEGGAEGNRLKGVGASGGTVTGKACVLHGPEDFDRMVPGGILVAKLTTPAWTPLFAMAGGVVTDIGGPLSHGSIVAREYGIPAVLGTGSASRLIENEQQVTVDGTNGYVIITEDN